VTVDVEDLVPVALEVPGVDRGTNRGGDHVALVVPEFTCCESLRDLEDLPVVAFLAVSLPQRRQLLDVARTLTQLDPGGATPRHDAVPELCGCRPSAKAPFEGARTGMTGRVRVAVPARRYRT